MLYLVATPIGNLEDITYRAVRILSSCSYILCEDQRKSQILLNHYGIKKELQSFHKFCEKKKEERILNDLKEGKEIALISDAGVPLISDPGCNLVQKCIENKLSFTAIPGPSSLMNALLLSGFNTQPLLFLGFLSKQKSEKEKEIRRMLFFPGTSICFETAKRIEETLHIIQDLDPSRPCAIAREMTKKFEECVRHDAASLLLQVQRSPLLGELVLVLGAQEAPVHLLPLEELISLLQNLFALDEKEAIKTAAKLRKTPKRAYYNLLKKKE